jgi:hypothetical protein
LWGWQSPDSPSPATWLYQYGLLEDVWEPFFGRGSEQVLHSFLSTLPPVPDAALGAAAYALDAVTGLIGGPLVVSAAIIALAETTRAVRWVNVVLGCWLVLAPVLLHYEPLHIGVRSGVLGIAIAGLSWFPGGRRSTQGGGWSALWKHES